MNINESYFFAERFEAPPIIKPNRITGEGRMKLRGADKCGDLKKKQRRKMAKVSKRRNRGQRRWQMKNG